MLNYLAEPMNQPLRKNIIIAGILFLLLNRNFINYSYGQTQGGDNFTYLFVIDISNTMNAKSRAMSLGIADMIEKGVGGKMKDGDTIMIWTYGDKVNTAEFKSVLWDYKQARDISNQIFVYLKNLKYSRSAVKNILYEKIIQLIPNKDNLIIYFVSDGTKPIIGVPFENDLQTVFRENYARWKAEKIPCITAIFIDKGKIINWAIGEVLPFYPVKTIAQMKIEQEIVGDSKTQPPVVSQAENKKTVVLVKEKKVDNDSKTKMADDFRDLKSQNALDETGKKNTEKKESDKNADLQKVSPQIALKTESDRKGANISKKETAREDSKYEDKNIQPKLKENIKNDTRELIKTNGVVILTNKALNDYRGGDTKSIEKIIPRNDTNFSEKTPVKTEQSKVTNLVNKAADRIVEKTNEARIITVKPSESKDEKKEERITDIGLKAPISDSTKSISNLPIIQDFEDKAPTSKSGILYKKFLSQTNGSGFSNTEIAKSKFTNLDDAEKPNGLTVTQNIAILPDTKNEDFLLKLAILFALSAFVLWVLTLLKMKRHYRHSLITKGMDKNRISNKTKNL